MAGHPTPYPCRDASWSGVLWLALAVSRDLLEPTHKGLLLFIQIRLELLQRRKDRFDRSKSIN